MGGLWRWQLFVRDEVSINSLKLDDVVWPDLELYPPTLPFLELRFQMCQQAWLLMQILCRKAGFLFFIVGIRSIALCMKCRQASVYCWAAVSVLELILDLKYEGKGNYEVRRTGIPVCHLFPFCNHILPLTKNILVKGEVGDKNAFKSSFFKPC